MPHWKMIWIGVSATWMLFSGFFLGVGALQGVLQKSVLGFAVFYNTDAVVKVWRYETRDFMIHADIPGKRARTFIRVPKEKDPAIDHAKSADEILAIQQAWVEQYPKAFVNLNNEHIMAPDKFAEMKNRFEQHIATIPKAWTISLLMFLLPPLITYLVLAAWFRNRPSQLPE